MNQLFRRYLENKCSPEEVKLLPKEFDAGQNEDSLKSLIRQQLEADREMNLANENESGNVLAEVYNNIQDQIAARRKAESSPIIPIYRSTWFRVAAAVIVILILGAGSNFLFFNNNKQKIARSNVQQVRYKNDKNDFLPGTEGEILTLANGKQIVLDSAGNGMLAVEGNTKVINKDGQIVYDDEDMRTDALLYNTMKTPRGRHYQLVLADGSKVWLNAASSIRYPATFAGKERKVEITGEAYFEIAHNAKKPFKVFVNSMEVQVFGTHFNIMGYGDENEVITTLVEGAVKITNQLNTVLLTPSKQAILKKSDQSLAVSKADVAKALAWKNGMIEFDGDDLPYIMRQLTRWYDVDISFAGAIPKGTYKGTIRRQVPLSKVLEILKVAGVQYKMEGKMLIVTGG